jgi:hypothetical protein
MKDIDIYVLYYDGEVMQVTPNPHDIAENPYNNVRDKLEVWRNGMLVEERE